MNSHSARFEPDDLFADIGRAFFMTAAEAVFVVDQAGQVVAVNGAGCKITGCAREELLTRSLPDLIFGSSSGERPFPFADLSPEKKVQGFLRDGNGRFWPTEIETRPLAENRLLCIVHLAEAQPAVERKLFHSLYENTAVGFWIVDEAGRFLVVNEGYLARSGYSRPELLGMSMGDVTVQKQPGEMQANLQQVKQRGYGLYEAQHRKKNGALWLIEISITYGNGRFFIFAHDITERKHLEDELRRKSNALEKSLNGFDIISQQGKFLYANQAYLTMWGYDSLAEILGTSPAGHCADPTVPEKIIRNLEEKGEYTLEFTALRKDGSTFQVLMAAQKVVDNQGVVTYVGTSIDITRREQARLALLAEQTRLNQMLDTIPDMVWLKDPNGAYLACNPSFERLMDVQEAQLLGKTDYEFFDKETAEFFRHHDRKAALAGEPTVNEEWIIMAGDGRRRLFETIKTPVRDESGQLLGVLGIARDITERKQAQLALQVSQEQYQRLFDTMQRGVVYQGADGIIISMNPAAVRILGKTKEEFLGKTSESVEHDTLTEDGQLFPGLEHPSMVALRTGKPVYDVPMQIYNPREQQYRLISITAVPLFRHGEARPYQVYTVFDDITERRKAEKSLRQSEERFRVAVKNSNFIPSQFDTNLRYQWIFNPHPDFDPLQVMGKRDDEIEESEGIRQLTALKQQVVDSGVGAQQEISFLRGDGLHVYDITIEPLFDDHGAVVGGASAAFDITRRKQAEDALYLISDTQRQIAALNDRTEIGRLVGETVHKLIGDGYAVITMLDEKIQAMRIVSMYGFGPIYQKLVHRFQIDPAKMTFSLADMTEDELRIFRSGRLEKFEDGLYALLTRKIPKRICGAVEKQLKISGIYTMGFVWHGMHYGGIILLARQDLTPYRAMIEALMNQASIAINRIKTEEALRESEERLRLFIEHAPASLAMFDHDMRYLAVSRRWLADYDLEGQNVIGRSHYEVFPEITEPLKALHRRGLAGEVLRADDDTFLRADGRLQWLRWEVRPWTTANGQIGGIVIFSEDITKRKETEVVMREMAENMAAAQQMTSSGSWEIRLTPDLEFVDPQIWSDECYRIFGVEPGSMQMTKEFFYEHVHPDDRALAFQTLQQAIHSLNEATYQYRLNQPDGSVRTIRDRIKVVVDEQTGRPVKVMGIVQDITESKKAEATIAHLNRQMELILNSAGEGIYGTDVNDLITFVNPMMAHMTGWKTDDLLGQNAHDVFHHTRADGTAYPAADCDIHLAMLAGQDYHAEEDLYWRRDGTAVTVEYTSTPIRETGQIIGMVTVVKDITERKRAAEQQGLLEEQLRQVQKMESIGRLAGGIAHDFNNQLTVIKLYSDMMLDTLAKDDPLLPKLEQIRQASDQAAGLTGQLLAFSRKQILQPVRLNLNSEVGRLQKMLSRLIGEDIVLSTNLAPDLWSVTVDPGQIEQIVMNLVVNARDAMPTGGMLTIETSNCVVDDVMNEMHVDIPSGRCVMLAITDTGHGMDQATQKQIFEPFFTTKPVGQGTGLGLSTVYGIVKQSGGAIFVYSEPGQGSTFKIYLPADSAAAEAGRAPQEDAELRRGNETILLVEDEVTLRGLVRDTLADLGYTVLEADNPGEALVLFEQQSAQIDLLLTDVVMPQMSGRELADQIRAVHPQIKVIFMSGYMDDAIMRHGILAVKVNFLPKPFTRHELTAKVREVLDKA